jgi:hypothetical protein
MRLVLTPKSDSDRRVFSRMELLLDRETGAATAMRFLDSTGNQETVYAFRPVELDTTKIQEEVSVRKASFDGSIPTFYPVYQQYDYIAAASKRTAVKSAAPIDHLDQARRVLAHDEAAANVTLESRDVVWTLTGRVDSQAEADRLLQLVRSQRRPVKVREVVSELTVADDSIEPSDQPRSENQPPNKPQRNREIRPGGEATLYDLLHKPVDVDFRSVPLVWALEAISDNYLDKRLTLDEPAIRDAGVSLQTPVSLVISGISLRSALKLLLADRDLSWIVDEGGITVTSRWVAEGRPLVKVYTAADLIEPQSDSNGQPNGEAMCAELRQAALDQLAQLLVLTVHPEEWDANGGPGSVTTDLKTGALVVRCPQRMHDDVATLLNTLRKLPAEGAKLPVAAALQVAREQAATPNDPSAATVEARLHELAAQARQAAISTEARRILKLLEQPTTVAWDNLSLVKVCESISREHAINLVIDEAGLLESGVTAKTPVTLHLKDVPFRTILRCLLDPLDLAYTVEDEVLQITSRTRAGGFGSRVYDLSPLLAPDDDAAVQLPRYAELVRESVAPESWDEVGGRGSIVSHVSTRGLVIRQTTEAHLAIGNLLANLMRMKSGEAPFNPPLSPETDAEREQRERILGQNVTIAESTLPLRTLATGLHASVDGRVWIDPRGIAAVGVNPDSSVTVAADDSPLSDALVQALQPLGLALRYDGGVLMISSPQRCGGPATTRVYGLPESLTAGNADANAIAAKLIDSLRTSIGPSYWENGGGSGTIQFEPRTQALVVYQTEQQHAEIERYLKLAAQASGR